MGKTNPSILIIGGGVAGMAAARSFADQDVDVHLVEKENCLGGHAAMWACMATDTCKNCGACLSIEMAAQVSRQKNVKSHLNTRVSSVEKTDNGYAVSLEDKDRFSAQKIIMATGFSPFDPAGISSFHHGRTENVITTAELNARLKQETLEELLKGKSDPKIGFLQCVGSRNRDLGKDFCSQVCCKISMRHADKLSYLYPDADITIFHMDLQVIGKEIRPLFNSLSKKVSLIQGVPAEILEDEQTKTATIVIEDKKTQSRKAMVFDLMVLSVGMEPSPNLDSTTKMLSLTPNSWGFFNTDPAVLSEDVIVAGCASGPKDILSSRQEGRIAATRIMEDLGLKLEKKINIVVFGEGSQADHTAEAVSRKGYPTYVFGPGTHLSKSSSVNIVNAGKIISLGGTAGNFSLLYTSEDNKKKALTCGAVILAQEPALSVNRPAGTSNKTLDPEALSDLIKNDPDRCPDNIVILLDYSGPEFKSWARSALDTAIEAKALNKNVSIIMNKMLVHGALGQRRYDMARQKGIDFLRFEAPEDMDIQDAGKGFSIKIKEATLPSVTLDISCDCLVIPPALAPAQGFGHTAALLKQDLDFQGFLQSANTRHRLTQSPRRGIFFAGTCHDETDLDDLDLEIKDILAAMSSRSPDLTAKDPGVEINQKKCAQCLTCIRICPHSAIVMNEKHRPQIVPDACFSCHLCVANCPAYAIESTAFSNDQIGQRIRKDRIAVLACERSAALAAANSALPDFVDLIPIPCACRISPDVILKTLLNGASKVIVSGCHQENCRSIDGTGAARESVEKVLSIPGLTPPKVVWEPVAANETVKFKRIISNASK